MCTFIDDAGDCREFQLTDVDGSSPRMTTLPTPAAGEEDMTKGR